MPARLVLEDGHEFHGFSFGAGLSAAGEVVFSTAMTGYPESLSDPSYKGQILVSTFPLIGNYGVPVMKQANGLPENFESEKVQVTGLVIADYSFSYSHWNAEKSLAEWLQQQNVSGIYGVDTRAITKIIREEGAMLGKIVINRDPGYYDPNKENLVAKVSSGEIKTYGSGRYRIVLVDCGTKNNIIRCLLKRDTTVTVVPWDRLPDPALYDGVLLSNGPGDPALCDRTIENTRQMLEGDKPVFGICLGSQIMALAAGGKTYKLKYGHRSHNQPVILPADQRCFVTSQNHGYAVDSKSMPLNWEVWFRNLNDDTCEGIRHKEKPFIAVQFHPEASAGPVDTEFLFDDFMNLVRERCR
ncbi:MAG TPA: glutamine-hydrolyzing carbamoyl-phosphate synthase small subunit [Bacteroidales bacterium]|nr:glutamine-hydrolyzing carbamoyl-phosphate synthase small subunit [Bacteroidales bacterium]